MGRYNYVVKICFSVLSALLILLGSVSQGFSAPSSLQITRITPSGSDVPAGRQIVFQFDRPVVPIGRMARKASEIPIAITPPLNCEWRWLNSQTLACQLDEASALKPATRYTIRVNPGIKARDGATLLKPVRKSFITIRPKVDNVWFKTWSGPGRPVIRLTFNQPVFKDSVDRHIFLATLENEDKRTGVTVTNDPDVKEKPLTTPSTDSLGEARRIWLVSPQKELPLDSKVALRVDSGIVSFEGPEKGIEKRVLARFSTFPPFIFEGVECTDNEGKLIRITP
ncbi:MAG: Ig-like domain-containing protein, partial [Deltaproteobacteria bacterium]|nr:Ig-like domain-containing protein [Deltaproteobacteria bacterium]